MVDTDGRLDYAKHEIFLTVDSDQEEFRLGSCAKEPETIDWIEQCVEAGDVFYDIWANIGAYSLVASKHSEDKAKVIAFEPSCTTFADLCRNIWLNECIGSIIPLSVALSDVTAKQYMSYSDTAPGAAEHTISQKPVEGVFIQPILTYKLDDLIRQFSLPIPTHMKIDVDGHESRLLEGAAQTLAGPRLKSLMIEIDETRPPVMHKILGELAAAGFEDYEKFERNKPNVYNYRFEK